MFRYQRQLDMIKRALEEKGIEVEFRPASKGDIEYLRGLLYPESVIEFYEHAEPSEWVDLYGVQLNTIADIWGENENTLPGDRAFALGYGNVASTDEGDTYCVDINSVNGQDEPAVVRVSHAIDEFMPDSEVLRHIHRVCDTFGDFLESFAKGELPSQLEHRGKRGANRRTHSVS